MTTQGDDGRGGLLTNGRRGLTVVVVDDEWWSRKGIVAALEATGHVRSVVEAENARDGLELAGRLDPHLLIVDLAIPSRPGVARALGGFDLIRDLAAMRRLGRPRVLVLTSLDHREHIANAIRAGADGYLVKGATGPRDLPLAIARLFRGEQVAPAAESSVMPLPTRSVLLTQTESALLPAICSGEGYRSIGGRLGYSHQHVKTTAATLLRKFGAANRTELSNLVRDAGLLTDWDGGAT